MKKAIGIVVMGMFIFNILSAAALNTLPIKNIQGEKAEDSVYEFIDSVGRKSNIPKKITRIVPAGNNAQLVLVGFAPELIVGIAKKPSQETLRRLVNFPADKVEMGQYYGKTPNFNKEEFIKAAPELILDIGERKKNILEDMDQIKENTGIETVFIELTPKTAADAYRTLGKLLSKEKKAEEIAEFLEEEIALIEDTLKKIPEKERVTFIQVGAQALQVDSKFSSHTEAIEFSGGINLAPQKEKGKKSKTEVLNMEEILQWNPDFIFVKDKISYDKILKDPMWSALSAVQKKKVYLIPQSPYNWVTSPPSINKMLGVYWSAQIMYPLYFSYDIKEIEKKFNRLIYGIID